jgi:hypothetical protein
MISTPTITSTPTMRLPLTRSRAPAMRVPQQCKEPDDILLLKNSSMHQCATWTYEDAPSIHLISIRDAMSMQNQGRSDPGLSPFALFLWSPASRQGYTSGRLKTGLYQ